MKRARKLAILAFVTLNIATVISSNVNFELKPWLRHFEWNDPLAPAYRAADWTLFYFNWYGYLAGIDQKYIMFSTLHRSYDYFWYYGLTEDGDAVLLPIELTPERSWWQRNLIDHKAAKFHLNMYNSKKKRRQYARYLCGEWSEKMGVPFRRVEVRHYSIRLPSMNEYAAGGLMASAGREDYIGQERVRCR